MGHTDNSWHLHSTYHGWDPILNTVCVCWHVGGNWGHGPSTSENRWLPPQQPSRIRKTAGIWMSWPPQGPRASRLLCLSQKCKIFTGYSLSNPISSAKTGSGSRSLRHWAAAIGAHPCNVSSKWHVHGMSNLLVLWVGFSEYHEHKCSSPMWSSCVTSYMCIISLNFHKNLHIPPPHTHIHNHFPMMNQCG